MKVHMTAIGGTGMGAIAGLLVEAGHEVRGSDLKIYPPMSDQLAALKIPVAEGYAPENLDWDPDLVVLGNTCKNDHPEYLAAKERNLKVVSFPQLLNEEFLQNRHPIVVAGTHGKTTTTSIIAHIFSQADLEPGFLIGGVPKDFQKGYALGERPYFVIEGDEYDSACFDKRPKFVHYAPQTLVLTSLEFDHADIYSSIVEVEQAFAMVFDVMPEDGHIFVAADSELAHRLVKSKAKQSYESYAVSANAGESVTTRPIHFPLDWHGEYEEISEGLNRMEVRKEGELIGTFDIPMRGEYNLSNTLAAIAVARRCGISVKRIQNALLSFGGVARRQQVRGIVDNIKVIDDFAHHPTAVKKTLFALKPKKGRLIAVFEPRSATSRRNIFQKDFPVSLAVADRVFVAPLFAPEKVPENERLNLKLLKRDIEAMQKPIDILGADQIVDELKGYLKPDDVVVIMSSGAFDGIHEKLLNALKSR